MVYLHFNASDGGEWRISVLGFKGNINLDEKARTHQSHGSSRNGKQQRVSEQNRNSAESVPGFQVEAASRL